MTDTQEREKMLEKAARYAQSHGLGSNSGNALNIVAGIIADFCIAQQSATIEKLRAMQKQFVAVLVSDKTDPSGSVEITQFDGKWSFRRNDKLSPNYDSLLEALAALDPNETERTAIAELETWKPNIIIED